MTQGQATGGDISAVRDEQADKIQTTGVVPTYYARRTITEKLQAWLGLQSDWTILWRATLLALTVLVWWRAISDWQSLYGIALRHTSLGYDISPTWHAERAWLAGRPPYKVFNFPYPPSHLIVMLPLAAFSEETVYHYAELALVIGLAATAMMSAKLIGRRYWGLTAAFCFLALHSVQPVGDEVVLENVSALIAVGMAGTLLLASRGRWNWAAVVLGTTLAIKPILAPVVLIFLLARRWKALSIAVGIPVILCLVAIPTIAGLNSLWSVLPFLFDRTGAGYDAYNASLFSVGALTGLSFFTTTFLRVVAGGLALLAAWWAWQFSRNETSRLLNTSGALMIGLFLAGPLTEDHYMLVLIPLAVGMSYGLSPMRWPTAWLGVAWLMAVPSIWFVRTHMISAATLGLTGQQTQMVNRCLGLGLVLLTLLVGMPFERALSARYARSSAPSQNWPRDPTAVLRRCASVLPLSRVK